MSSSAPPEGFDPGEDVRLCAEADLRPDGRFGREWLVVGESRLWVVSDGDAAPSARLELPLEELGEPKARTLVGGGALEVSRNGERMELVRYTASRSARFGAAAQVLGKWLEGEEAEVPEEEQRYCPRCGMPLAEGTKVCPACLPRTRTLRRLIGYLAPRWKPAVGLALMALVHTGLGLVPPYLQKPLMDEVLAPKGEQRPLDERLRLLGLLVLALLVAHVLMAVISALRNWLVAWLGNRISHDIRVGLYQHLQFLSLGFYDKRQMGTVISRVNQDTGRLQEFLVWGSQDLVTNLLLIVGISGMLLAMNAKLALFVFLPAPIVILLSTTVWRRIRHYMHKFFQRWSRLNAVLNESLSGLRVIKAFAQEPRHIDDFRTRSDELAISGTGVERVWSILFSGLSLVMMLGTLLVWYVGGREVLFGPMTLGTLMVFLTLVGMFYQPLRFMSMLLNWASRSLAAAERVFEVLDTAPEVDEAEDAVPMPDIQGRVEFRDVTFGYEPHRPVLKGISYEVAPGEMIGLVGHSGAGKTTTINLLCRFYDVDEGQILIDGEPISKIRLEDLRQQIGIVPQDTFLFAATIAENIAYAKPGATKEEIITAARAANAHEFILKKPDGYETLLGEKGQGLSAGEQQRLAIARAVLHDPAILILDEATSQVDVETEKGIQEAIQRLVEGRTTFAIAHRLSTLKYADRLIVLKEGEIAEMGTHDELLAAEGEFHRLVQTYQEISTVRAVER
ncbi:MAG: ABC transporter transmembrane domain-containing protein [Armatimonadota bacterium]|nr:ABC transporter transmembrane domain-containing protein [Armatimonadota bacterium]